VLNPYSDIGFEMADPEDVNYKPNLTPQSLEKAQTELFEDPKQRLGSLQSLRRWVREQPHFTCRTGKITASLHLSDR
jgi:hypothetical protein